MPRALFWSAGARGALRPQRGARAIVFRELSGLACEAPCVHRYRFEDVTAPASETSYVDVALLIHSDTAAFRSTATVGDALAQMQVPSVSYRAVNQSSVLPDPLKVMPLPNPHCPGSYR